MTVEDILIAFNHSNAHTFAKWFRGCDIDDGSGEQSVERFYKSA
jgi:hypothetical protein